VTSCTESRSDRSNDAGRTGVASVGHPLLFSGYQSLHSISQTDF